MILNRRDFLKTGSLTALGLGLNAWSPAFLKRRLVAGPAEGETKLVFIFQRGGSDGVNTLIPRGDPEYNATNRPTLFIPQADAIDLGNGFAQLHPMMQPMMEIYNHTGLNGVAGPGNLAILHRIGYSGQSQSHFDSQQFWENGRPGDPSFEEGMLYRQVVNTIDTNVNRLAAVSVSSTQMVALKGPISLPTVSDPARYTFSGSTAKVRKFLGELPGTPLGPDGTGVLGLYGGPRDFATKPYRDLVYGTGLALADSINIVQGALAQGPYVPENGAVYSGSLGQRLQTVAMLLKRTPVRILGVNIGGWDTHTNQGQIYGQHGDLLTSVAEGFQALYRDLQSQWQNLVVVTMTEFGRTSIENGSFGTDHAYACVVFVAGGAVRGGVYNCDPTTWAAGDLFSQSSRYVRRRTDYRAVFGEIFMRHFGDNMALLNQVIPGYSAAAAANPGDFNFLNFLPA
jgi:uncharacterized protein (DUF1501 family)